MRNERELAALCWGGGWITITLIVETLSFFPSLAPPHVDAWRFGFGIPAILFGLGTIALLPRVRERNFDRAQDVVVYAGLAASFTLLLITPATLAVYFQIMVVVFSCAFFSRMRTMLIGVSVLVAEVLATLFITLPGHPVDLAPQWLVVLVPAMCVVAPIVFVRRQAVNRALEEARRRALTDPLTGLGNRRSLDIAIEEHLRDDTAGSGGLLLIDLDNFKAANTLHGHLGGDHTLRMVGEAIMAAAQADDVVARIGGDEIVVFVPRATREELVELAAAYREAVRSANRVVDLPGVELDASVGLACFPQDGRTPTDLLTVADLSMYAVKATRPAPRRQADAAVARSPGAATDPAFLVDRRRAQPSAESPLRPAGASPPSARRQARWVALSLAAIAVTVLLSLLVAGGATTHPAGAFAWCGGVLVLAAVVALLVPSPRILLHPLVDAGFAGAIALLIYLTGGPVSQAYPLLLILVMLQAVAQPPRHLAWRILLPPLVALSPLAYQQILNHAGGPAAIAMFGACVGCCLAVAIALHGADHVLNRLEERARELAAIDPMTNVANRRAFSDAVDGALTGGAGPVAVVMIDLDDFSDVNTIHGHLAGDALLRDIADALSGVVRDGDCLARVGGDEFAAVLPGVDEATARTIAERFTEVVARCTALSPDAARARVSASAGYAMHPRDGATADELVAHADRAMMEVKERRKRAAAISVTPAVERLVPDP